MPRSLSVSKVEYWVNFIPRTHFIPFKLGGHVNLQLLRSRYPVKWDLHSIATSTMPTVNMIGIARTDNCVFDYFSGQEEMHILKIFYHTKEHSILHLVKRLPVCWYLLSTTVMPSSFRNLTVLWCCFREESYIFLLSKPIGIDNVRYLCIFSIIYICLSKQASLGFLRFVCQWKSGNILYAELNLSFFIFSITRVSIFSMSF